MAKDTLLELICKRMKPDSPDRIVRIVIEYETGEQMEIKTKSGPKGEGNE